MKKILIKSLIFSVIICILSAFFCFNTNAATGTVISFSGNKIDKGKNVTVKVSFSAPKSIMALEAVVGYDDSVLKFVSGNDANCSGGGGKIVAYGSGKSLSTTLVFKAIGVGKANISITQCTYVPTDGDKELDLSGASASLTVIDKSAQSSDATLKSLSVSKGKLTPVFSKSTYNYSVTVENEVNSLHIGATTNNNKASVKISGSDSLKVGKNTRIISVTAESGKVLKYTVSIIRKNKETTESEPTSSGDTSSVTEETDNRLIEIDGSYHYLSNEIESVNKPNGFLLDEYNYKGEKIPVYKAKSSPYVIFSIKSGSNKSLRSCIYNTETDIFNAFMVQKIGGKDYTVLDISNLPDLDGYTQELAEIHNMEVYAYKSNNQQLNANEYLFFDAINENGKLDFYRYDTLEDTIQRYPKSEIVETVTTPIENDEKDIELPFGLDLITVLFMVSGLLTIIGIVLVCALIVAKKRRD